MNGNHKLRLILILAFAALVALPLSTAWADCPDPPLIHLGLDPSVTPDANAVPGSKTNPAISKGQAKDICQECLGAAVVFEYNSSDPYKYSYGENCKNWLLEKNGVPLAQSVVTALLGLVALGLLAWGIYERRRLKRLEAG